MHNRPVAAAKVLTNLGCQAVRMEQGRNGGRLRGADLDSDHTSGAEDGKKLGNEAAILVEPIDSSEERRCRFMIPDICREGGARFDIGRIAKDQIESLPDSLGPIAHGEARTLFESERGRIGPGDFKCRM